MVNGANNQDMPEVYVAEDKVRCKSELKLKMSAAVCGSEIWTRQTCLKILH